jgi:hypothetical protein
VEERSPSLDREQLVEPVVSFTDTVDGSKGLGVVVFHDDEASYVATAWHVAYNIAYVPIETEPQIVEGPDDAVEALTLIFGFGGPTREVVTPRNLGLDYDGVCHTVEIAKGNREFDAAVLRVTPKLSITPAQFAHEYVIDEPVRLVGQFPPVELFLIYEGRYQGISDQKLVVTAHAHPGCSGGPVFVQRGDRWVLLGITSGIGGIGNQGIHHITFLVPGDWMHFWIEEGEHDG